MPHRRGRSCPRRNVRLGVAAMTLSEIDEAIIHLRAAVDRRTTGPAAGDVSAEARMSLASALLLRGLPGSAAREIEAATRDLSGLEAARAHVQRAAILQELGKDETPHSTSCAGSCRRCAAPATPSGPPAACRTAASSTSADEPSWRRRPTSSKRAACASSTASSCPAGYAEQNLGFVKAQRGDVPASLRLIDAAAERYRQFGLVEASLLLDRAGVLLSVRLRRRGARRLPRRRSRPMWSRDVTCTFQRPS